MMPFRIKENVQHGCCICKVCQFEETNVIGSNESFTQAYYSLIFLWKSLVSDEMFCKRVVMSKHKDFFGVFGSLIVSWVKPGANVKCLFFWSSTGNWTDTCYFSNQSCNFMSTLKWDNYLWYTTFFLLLLSLVWKLQNWHLPH